MIGKYVIVRADRAGVFFGILESKNGQEVTLKDVRKIYYWDGACAVEQLAVDGTNRPEKCKLTVVVDSIAVEGVIQVLPCTDKSIESLKNVKEWKV